MTSRHALLLAAVAGCGANQPRAPEPDVEDPALLVSSEDIAPSFTVQQKVHATFREREIVFQAVIQAAGGRLTVVALTPQGQRAFVIEQTGRSVRFRRHVSRELPFSPWHILVDIHRAYFRGTAAQRPDGRHRVAHGREVMFETWRGGRVVRRTFQRAGSRTPGAITIDYAGAGTTLLERTVTYRDRVRGYTLVVTPVRYSPLAE
jgi:hypothetical protein